MAWNARTRELFEITQRVFEDLAEYRPLTLRQVYYQLVKDSAIENTRSSYQRLSRILNDARKQGLIPWEWMEDRTRNVLRGSSFQDRSEFLANELELLLQGYRRDLLQGQETRPEVWIEKDALSRVAHRAADPFDVLVASARGFSSVSYLHELRERAWQNAENGQYTDILYFGDLDPSGWTMLPSMLKTLHDDFNLKGIVHAERVALNPDQVSQYDLPNDPDAMKEKDTNRPRYQQWLRDDGFPDTLSVELDALPPATLHQLIQEAIEENLDWSRFQQEVAAQEDDMGELERMRPRARTALEREFA